MDMDADPKEKMDLDADPKDKMDLDDKTWGWDLGRNKAYHDSNNTPGVVYPASLASDEMFQVSASRSHFLIFFNYKLKLLKFKNIFQSSFVVRYRYRR